MKKMRPPRISAAPIGAAMLGDKSAAMAAGRILQPPLSR